MDSETAQKFEMVSIKKQANVPSLEEQSVCFIDFLNSDDFIENPSLRHFYVQLVSLYHAAVCHGVSYTRSKRYYLSKSYVIEFERHKPEGEHRIKEYSEIRIISEASWNALAKISFNYDARFPEHEHDKVIPEYRSLMSDITDIVNDLCSVIAFNRFFSEYADQLPSVSDQLYNDFMIHWGANHCVDLIRAIHLKLNDDFKWHKCKYRDSLTK